MLRPLIACTVGAVFGMLIALWAVARHPADVTLPTSAASSAGTGVQPQAPAASPTQPAQPDTVTVPEQVGGATNSDVKDVMKRAGTLADRADVRALMSLRDEVMVRAQLSGALDSDRTKRQVAEIDRDLERARALRLALDRAAFRNETDRPTAARPR